MLSLNLLSFLPTTSSTPSILQWQIPLFHNGRFCDRCISNRSTIKINILKKLLRDDTVINLPFARFIKFFSKVHAHNFSTKSWIIPHLCLFTRPIGLPIVLRVCISLFASASTITVFPLRCGTTFAKKIGTVSVRTVLSIVKFSSK